MKLKISVSSNIVTPTLAKPITVVTPVSNNIVVKLLPPLKKKPSLDWYDKYLANMPPNSALCSYYRRLRDRHIERQVL